MSNYNQRRKNKMGSKRRISRKRAPCICARCTAAALERRSKGKVFIFIPSKLRPRPEPVGRLVANSLEESAALNAWNRFGAHE